MYQSNYFNEIYSIFKQDITDLGRFFVNKVYSFINLNTEFKITLIDNNAKFPTKTYPGSTMYDVFSSQSFLLKAHKRSFISTGLCTEFSKNFYLRITGYDKMSIIGIDTFNNLIDYNYRDEIRILLINNSDTDYQITNGSKIAQIILERCANVDIEKGYLYV